MLRVSKLVHNDDEENYCKTNLYSWVLLILALGYALIISVPLGMLYLWLISRSRFDLEIISVYLSVGLSVLAASRTFGLPFDDIEAYFKMYESIRSGVPIREVAILQLGSTYEMGFLILLKMLAFILPPLNVVSFAFFMALLVSLSFFASIFYVNRHKGMEELKKNLLLSIVFLGLANIYQLIRQTLSSIFIFHAMNNRKLKRLGLLVVGTTFHLSAPLVFSFIKVCEYYANKKSKKLIILILVVTLAFLLGRSYINTIDLSVISKFKFFIEIAPMEGGYTYVDMSNLKIFTVAFALIIFGLYFNRNKNNTETYRFNAALVLLFYFIYLILLPYASLSSRLTSFVSSVFLGYFVASVLPIKTILDRYIYSTLILLKTYIIIGTINANFWYNYPPFSSTLMFYYRHIAQ